MVIDLQRLSVDSWPTNVDTTKSSNGNFPTANHDIF